MTDEQDIIEAEATTTALATPVERAITLGGGGMSLPSVDQQAEVLAEYDKRKKFFLSWLKEHFQPGVHYGIPPGCEPRGRDSDQWRHKPSLYDAGARLFMDLFGFKATYASDTAAWEMLGKKPGCFCRQCKLTLANGDAAGEGAGVFRVGEKKMQENAAIKMADKRARVAAVLDACPFARELFTQDLEDLGSPMDKLKEWAEAQRAEFEESLSTDAFLATVAEACLYGKRTITNNAEAKRVSDALERADFNWETGERNPKANAPASAEPQPVPIALISTFMERVSAKRDADSSLNDGDFIAAVVKAEFGPGASLADLDRAKFDALGASLGAGKYDWATGEQIPDSVD